MNSPFARHLLLTLCLATGSGLVAAGGKPSAPTPAVQPAAPAASDPVLSLPTLQVRESRIKKIDKDIARLDKQIAREKKKIKSTDLDKTLNNEKLSRAAAIFGGNSAEHLSAVAATRVALLETERSLMEAMKRPGTLEELALLEAEVSQIRVTRRNLDDAAKQR